MRAVRDVSRRDPGHSSSARSFQSRRRCWLLRRPDAVQRPRRPRSTWARYGTDANHDGTTDVYDPEDAIPSAAGYLSELARRAHGNLDQAILGYNHSPAYVRDILARSRVRARE